MPKSANGEPNLKPPARGPCAININSRGSLVTGGEAKQRFIRKWLREKDVDQTSRELKTFDYTRWTFYVSVGALIAAIIGIMVTVFHV